MQRTTQKVLILLDVLLTMELVVGSHANAINKAKLVEELKKSKITTGYEMSLNFIPIFFKIYEDTIIQKFLHKNI